MTRITDKLSTTNVFNRVTAKAYGCARCFSNNKDQSLCHPIHSVLLMNAIGNSAVVQIKAQVSPRIFSNASSRSWNGGGRIQNAFRGIAIFRRTGVP